MKAIGLGKGFINAKSGKMHPARNVRYNEKTPLYDVNVSNGMPAVKEAKKHIGLSKKQQKAAGKEKLETKAEKKKALKSKKGVKDPHTLGTHAQQASKQRKEIGKKPVKAPKD